MCSFLHRSYNVLRYSCSVEVNRDKAIPLPRVFMASLKGMVIPDVHFQGRRKFSYENMRTMKVGLRSLSLSLVLFVLNRRV